MSGWWHTISLRVFDLLLDGILRFSPGAAILAVAVLTSLVLVLVRKWTTGQDWLRRARLDRLQLRRLIKTAKKNGNAEAVARYRETDKIIALNMLKQEKWPLLISLIPIAMMATWCFARLDLRTPEENESFEVIVETPLSATGAAVHIVPVDGLMSDGWVRELEPLEQGDRPHGAATWTIKGRARQEPYQLLIRTSDRTLEHPVRIGQGAHEPGFVDHGDGYSTRMVMEQLKFFGVGDPGWIIPPWIVVYLVLAIIFSTILKRSLHVL